MHKVLIGILLILSSHLSFFFFFFPHHLLHDQLDTVNAACLDVSAEDEEWEYQG